MHKYYLQIVALFNDLDVLSSPAFDANLAQ